MPYDSKSCIVRTAIGGGIDVFFGNKNFGKIPPPGSIVKVEYLITLGLAGNIDLTDPSKVLVEFDSDGLDLFGNEISLRDHLQIKCISAPSLGSNQESLALTRLLAPKTSRSYVLANPDNYVTFFEKFGIFSIIEAFTTFNDNYLDDDNVVYVLLVPDITQKLKSNETYFDVKDDEFKLTTPQRERIYNLIDESGQKIVTTELKIIDPKLSRYVVNVIITVFEGYDPLTVKQEIIMLLSEYFLSIRRRDKIPKSDLIAIIESIQGVDSVSLFFVSEKNEKYQKSILSQTIPTTYKNKELGLDEFGDIVLEKDEIAVVNGGWKDRNDVFYDRGAAINKLSAVNIDVKSIVSRTYNTDVNLANKRSLKSTYIK